MLDVQSRLMVLDEALALVRRTTGLSLEAIFFGAYLLSIGVIWTGLVLIGQRVYRTAWATAALAAAFSMRHGIPRTGANSFEAYFHPRMLAFAIGLLAIAAVLRGRSWLGVALVGGAALAHITTGLWFAVLIGVALAILDRRMRTVALAGSVSVVAGVLWALATDRLASPLAPMDEIWLRALATKESLFATTWPPIAWAYNLGFLVLLWGAHLVRRARCRASDADTALVWGGTALVALFLLTLPFVASGLSLFVQLQIGRVFWLVDLLATIYVVGVLADGGGAVRTSKSWPAAPAIACGLVLLLTASRGTYIMFVERPERPLFAVRVDDSPWEDAMRWIASQPGQPHVFADPGHAWKYGTSVRAAAARDVLNEEVKDSALAIYSRDAAVRVVERTDAIGDFPSLTAERALALAEQYELTHLVTEADLALDLVYQNTQFRIYTLP